MDRLISRRPLIRQAFAFAPFVLLVVLSVLLVVFYEFMQRSRAAVAISRESRLAAERVLSDLKDMETGQRGFLLMGTEQYLEPFYQGERLLRSDTPKLRQFMADDSLQQVRYRRMQHHIGRRVALLDSTIVMRRAGDTRGASDVIRSGAGKLHMDSIRALVHQMDVDELGQLEAQFAREARAGTVLVFAFGIGMLLVFALGLAINSALLRQARRQAEALRQIEQQTQKLQAQHVELEAQNEELFTLNEELTVATEVAEQANEAKTAFLMSMSHELRTPLNAIAGYTDLIEAGVYGEVSEPVLEALNRIHVNQQQLLFIINQILDYTGLRSETNAPQLQEFDVVPVINSLEAIVAPLVAAKGLLYLADVRDAPAFAYGHPERLRQVLTNLIGNAVKFTPAPGEIVLGCETGPGNTVVISVTDTGIGMSPALMSRIFEPFVQGNVGATRDATGGLGLGLAISRELMRSMGGTIEVASVAGSGSTFKLTLHGVSALPAPPVSAANLL